MLNGKQLQNFVSGTRAAEKARAPHLTAARKALKKATDKLVKAHGGDSLMVSAYDALGNQINGGTALAHLQRGMPVKVQLWHTLSEPQTFLDAGEYRMAGESTVQIAI